MAPFCLRESAYCASVGVLDIDKDDPTRTGLEWTLMVPGDVHASSVARTHPAVNANFHSLHSSAYLNLTESLISTQA